VKPNTHPAIRLALTLVGLASRLAPSWRRGAFAAQWSADVLAYWRYLERRNAASHVAALDLLGRSVGAIRHAVWLRTQEWRIDMLVQDIRFALRLLVRRPAFTVLAVVTLGLGIGANATIFSWVEALVWRPLPGVADGERIVAVHAATRTRSNLSISYPNFADFRDRRPSSVEGLLCYSLQAATLREGNQADRAWGVLVSGNYFDVLGVRAAYGRTFSPEEDRTPGTHPVAVLSHRFWERRFGSDPTVVGRTVLLNERAFTVVGVAAAGFQGTNIGVAVDLWVPMMMQSAIVPGDRLNARGNGWLKVLARLAPGATVGDAQAGLAVVAGHIADAYPGTAVRGVAVYPLWRAPQEASGMMAPVLAVLMAVVGIVLFIACANIASLLLARASSRQREIAVRLAVGATRWRLLRQLLTENTLLALLGGLAGVALARWTAGSLVWFLPPTPFPLLVDAGIGPRVLLFSMALSLGTALVFGLAPALQTTRTNLVPALKDSGGGAGRPARRGLFRQGLVVVQVTLSLVLLVTAGLFLRTLQNAQAVDPGFSLRNGVIATVDLLPAGYDATRGPAFFRSLLETASSVPGVSGASLIDQVPLHLGGSDTAGEIEGYTRAKDEEIALYYSRVAPRYFETMGIPLVAGRVIDERDGPGTPDVIVVNETAARRYWRGRNPIGGRVRFGKETVQVVGVVRDGKYQTLNEAPRPFIYFPLYQAYRPGVTLVVRSDADPRGLMASIEKRIRALDPRVPVFDVQTMAEHLQLSVFMVRMAAVLLGMFGVMALLLATTGLYGVLAHLVSQRTHEIGVRMALGAGRWTIVGFVIRQGLLVTAIGLALGVLAAAAVTRLVASQLIGVGPLDPISYLATLALLTAVALLACYLPARRAARQDPLEALRWE